MHNKLQEFITKVKETYYRELPIYIYSDEICAFIHSIEDGKTDDGMEYTDYTLSTASSFAINFRKFTREQREETLNKLNKAAQFGNTNFRFWYGKA